MSSLLLGPLIRRGPENGFAVWLEASAACTAVVRTTTDGETAEHVAHTFEVGGHHYALIDVDGVRVGAEVDYEITLEGSMVWPDASLGIPPTRVVVWEPRTPFRVSGGSCRQQAPQNRRRGSRLRGCIGRSDAPVTDALGADALAALANEAQQGERPLPHLLILSGDQVYADERHESMTAELEERRGGPPQPGWPQISSFEEYTWLYQRTWAHPLVRWLLASVPSLMIFDDHDVIDDWNISDTWTTEIAERPWWNARLQSALMSYWVYQHLGNLSPEQRAHDPVASAVLDAQSNGTEALRNFATRAGTGPERLEVSWSYRVAAGPVQVVVLDARNGRVLDPEDRSMLSPRDWHFLERALEENPDSLVVSSVPWLLPPGVHNLERLASAAVAGRWGDRAANLGEKLRRAIDLEHWAAFGDSVERLRMLFASLPGDRIYPALVFSGDVHFAYLAGVDLGASQQAYQVVSSPMRQGDAAYEQLARASAMTSAFDSIMRRLLGSRYSRRAKAARQQVIDGIWTDNNIATFVYHDDSVEVRLDAAVLHQDGLSLRSLLNQRLTVASTSSTSPTEV